MNILMAHTLPSSSNAIHSHCIRLLFALSLLVFAQHSFAAHQANTVSAKIHKVLLEAQTLNGQKEYIKALAIINRLDPTRLTKFEVSQLSNMKGFIYYQQENYPHAIAAFNKSLQYPSLSKDIKLNTLLIVTQIYFMQEKYSQTIQTANKYIAIEPSLKPEIYMLKGQAYYQQNKFSLTVSTMQRVLQIKKQLHKKAGENDLLLLSAAYQELELFKKRVDTLTQLVTLFPEKRYFLALSGAYFELGNNKKQLAVYETLYEKDWLTEPQQLSNLVQLYMLNDAPIKAAHILEKALAKKQLKSDIKHLSLLARAWYSAREVDKAIPPLKNAARLSNNGKRYIKLGYLFSQMERWDDAIEAYNLARKKGGLPKNNKIALLKGVACYYAGHIKIARQSFKQALQQKQLASTAKSWLNILNQENS